MNLNDLNPMQRRAAETLEGPVLILAGAGSGKTRTLTYRVANLLEHGVKAWHILALTFTNKAAREMRERIEHLAGADAGEAWIGTFHSICCRILRRDIEKLGYERSFTIYDTDDSKRVIRDILKELNLDEKAFTRTLWQMCTECIVVFPDGVNVLPWMLCGTNEIGLATAEKMQTARLVVWAQHGIYGAGKDLDETFGLIETAEKAAEIYMKIAHLPLVNTITDEQMHLLEKRFGVKARDGYLA